MWNFTLVLRFYPQTEKLDQLYKICGCPELPVYKLHMKTNAVLDSKQ